MIEPKKRQYFGILFKRVAGAAQTCTILNTLQGGIIPTKANMYVNIGVFLPNADVTAQYFYNLQALLAYPLKINVQG